MATPKLDSMLLASTDPTRLHDWYSAALAPDNDEKVDQYRILDFGGFYLLIDTRDDISATNPEPGRTIINFDVADARAVVDRMQALGTTWVAELEDRDGSLFATALDPDGNFVQIIQMSPEALREMARSEVGDAVTALSASKAFQGFSVNDLDVARPFYGETLGLVVNDGEMGMLELRLPGRENLIIYPKDDHMPATFTILNFPVPDIDAAVTELAERGVTFERYDGMDQDDRGIARDPRGPAVAWFKDPAGNILSVLQT